jgi:hypothetical protein
MRAREVACRIGRGCAEQSDLLEPPGRRCAAGRRRHFRFSGIVVRRFWLGATMELGRSMMMMMMMMRRRRASAASYGVIDNRSEKLEH